MEPLDAALAAHRSIVVLSVSWSVYSGRALATLESASSKLDPLGITLAVVDEESPDVRKWLSKTSPEALGGDYPRGAGSLFWLEDGAVLDVEIAGGKLTLDELLVRTHGHWALGRTHPH